MLRVLCRTILLLLGRQRDGRDADGGLVLGTRPTARGGDGEEVGWSVGGREGRGAGLGACLACRLSVAGCRRRHGRLFASLGCGTLEHRAPDGGGGELLGALRRRLRAALAGGPGADNRTFLEVCGCGSSNQACSVFLEMLGCKSINNACGSRGGGRGDGGGGRGHAGGAGGGRRGGDDRDRRARGVVVVNNQRGRGRGRCGLANFQSR
mmetsp:Transcript_14424/g.50716  ORF Transcript_14424/g.50716 Transcript_14424/m.50716 type:complete len:209 (-) Transcript_14424:1065-1691(-)